MSEITDDNRIINGLWVGDRLSALELLTIHSFTHHGHTFHLWVYNELKNTLPPNIILKDANTIIPEEKIFRKKSKDPKWGIGKGSLAFFSDLFRCKLLYMHGGWWVDMDVTCLRPFNFSAPYFFRNHPTLPMVNNVMKSPKKAEVMRLAYKELEVKCNANLDEWLLPNKIINKQIIKLELGSYIQEKVSNPECGQEIGRLIFRGEKIPKEWFFIHWMNEVWVAQNFPKNQSILYSSLAKFYQFYNIEVDLRKMSISKLRWELNYLLDRVLRNFRFSESSLS